MGTLKKRGAGTFGFWGVKCFRIKRCFSRWRKLGFPAMCCRRVVEQNMWSELESVCDTWQLTELREEYLENSLCC